MWGHVTSNANRDDFRHCSLLPKKDSDQEKHQRKGDATDPEVYTFSRTFCLYLTHALEITLLPDIFITRQELLQAARRVSIAAGHAHWTFVYH